MVDNHNLVVWPYLFKQPLQHHYYPRHISRYIEKPEIAYNTILYQLQVYELRCYQEVLTRSWKSRTLHQGETSAEDEQWTGWTFWISGKLWLPQTSCHVYTSEEPETSQGLLVRWDKYQKHMLQVVQRKILEANERLQACRETRNRPFHLLRKTRSSRCAQ